MTEPAPGAAPGVAAGAAPGAAPGADPADPAAATHFGFTQVPAAEKAQRVAQVFRSVAPSYDRMNDVLSGGLHRLWKAAAVRHAQVRPGMRILDVAGGTGDLSAAMARRVGPGGRVILTDINDAMLAEGRDRLLDAGLPVDCVRCDAESLPFADASFDRVIVSFGLRNMTHKDRALASMTRVLRPGGQLLVLEFSRIWAPLAPLYDAYSLNVMPWLGARIAGDGHSYRYLAESIRMHPPQEELAGLLRAAGLVRVEWFNFAAGICALHMGVRP